MLINPIASGSSGNAYYISDGQSSLLLDAGIPLAQIQAGCGYKVSQLSGCLVTHGHGDHVKAAKALARMGVNIYTSQGTADMANLTGHRICTVRALESFHAGTCEVLPFDVEHDVPEPLGFLIRSTEKRGALRVEKDCGILLTADRVCGQQLFRRFGGIRKRLGSRRGQLVGFVGAASHIGSGRELF